MLDALVILLHLKLIANRQYLTLHLLLLLRLALGAVEDEAGLLDGLHLRLK